MLRFLAIACALSALTPVAAARAEWMIDQGTAIVSPTETNSTLEVLVISCGDPYLVEVFSRGGPVMPVPAVPGLAAGYFYKPGRIVARIDDAAFAMSAAGSGAAMVLFAEGTAADNYLAPVPRAFVDALRGGTSLTLAFDIAEETTAADGTAHETFARFPLAGSAAVLDAVLAGCR